MLFYSLFLLTLNFLYVFTILREIIMSRKFYSSTYEFILLFDSFTLVLSLAFMCTVQYGFSKCKI